MTFSRLVKINALFLTVGYCCHAQWRWAKCHDPECWIPLI